MLILLRFLLLALLVPGVAVAAGRAPVTILVSIDGFRADYLARGLTPTLSALARSGASAAMRPSFPSKTYPNHYTLVTGLRPDRNGIVGNKMEDAARPGETFTMEKSEDAFWWQEAEPIWTAAEKAGIRTATMFWPGSNVENGGVRPHDWWAYDKAIPEAQRVDAVLDWLRRPAATRPRFVTLYFDTVDTAGHHHGPVSPEVDAALRAVDGQIARLRHGLAELHQPANLVIVADHGMAATSPDRVVLLKTIADPADMHVVDAGPVATIDPLPAHEAALASALLRPLPHATCYRKADLPARLRYGHNPRVAPFVCLADMGWLLLEKLPADGVDLGSHGYDNAAPEMQALFVAAGPAFRHGVRLAPFDNVDVYALLRDLLRLPAKAGIDGSDAAFARALAR
ncbi:alkaline phosphatase family protein [Sphingomonas nostoxanthinifaciens]|uniref:alkaline phosphatase family protein n=1 Tax=Sphingomonas nostoxanthinifaciens TaxID=2872652 RepID=UPI001CC1FB43|nr:ectonucleotide pyrophosphatase/phosphodiesterase [Sphingomonas nostoxanthinifaciens]UAK24962.1 ectonucleotide pyrophosphatase/phosphodiesterase [Sphingomonas nostoxanthinifaciens]